AEIGAEEPAAKPKRSRRKKVVEGVEAAPEAEAAEPAIVPAPAAAKAAPEPANDQNSADEKPKRRSRAKAVENPPEGPVLERQGADPLGGDIDDGELGPDGQPRRGWWQRTFGG
ncbi:MAG: ribonuclease E/G, partial [Pseudomonadota bacterium]|nr:ribonuclease E/G [Pseudomonadota bacterium]